MQNAARVCRVRNSRWGRRIAGWPSAAVVGCSILAIFLASRLLPESAVWPVSTAAFTPAVVYCLLRTTRRVDIIGIWLAPSAVSAIVHDITGVPQWTIALPVLLLGLCKLVADDDDERGARAQPA